MPFYQYRARDKEGDLVTGSLEADDKSAVEDALDKMGLIPISVGSPKKSGAGAGARVRVSRLKGLFERVPHQDIILFSRQLATLFAAGVPLTRALGTLEKQVTTTAFRVIILKIREDVEGGGTFSAAISRHPKVFPELYAHMVEAGEAGGILDSVLDRLAFMLEKAADTKAKVKSATLYPKIVIGAIIMAVIVLMTFVIPKFTKLYATFQVELPFPTRVLIGMSNIFLNYWYLAIIFVASVYMLFRYYTSTESGSLNWDRLRLKVPVFGPIILKSIHSRFSRVLGSLYRSGLPILQSLDISSRAVENKVIAREIKKIEEDVREGKPLSEPMEASPHFPPMVVQMVLVGEDTGNLDSMLEKVAEYYDSEVDASIRNLTTTLEPILLSFIFVIVLFLALAIFLPMWDILKIVRR